MRCYRNPPKVNTMLKVTICALDATAGDDENVSTHEFAREAGDFLVSYVSDEFYEQGERDEEYRVGMPQLHAAFGAIYTGLATERDFSFIYDGELFTVLIGK